MQTPSSAWSASPPPDDELAAAIAAVELVLAADSAAAAADTQPAGPSWHHSAKLAVQGLRPSRASVIPRWSTIERLRRGVGGGSGIVGL